MSLFAMIREDPLYKDLNLRLICIGLISSLGAMGFGFDNGWWGSALGLSEFKKKYGTYDATSNAWALGSQKTSVATGTGSAGLIIGCLLAPYLTSTLGRKKTFLALSMIKIVGITLEASAISSFWQLVVGRVIVYAAIGISSNVVPMYQSECAPPRVRGLSCFFLFFFFSFFFFTSSGCLFRC
jgi:SP family sugar:H+ symporter-like MFS transporter